MKIVDFVKPETIDEVFSHLNQLGPNAVIIAGGTSFQFVTGETEKTAIDITSLDLKGIKVNADSFCVGALTKISEIQSFSNDGWVLSKVAKRLSTQQIRNMSTLGGNIAQVFPWSDFPTVLLAINAKINTVSSEGIKIYDAVDFFKQQPSQILNNKALITKICIPKISGSSGFGYHKEVRTSGAFSTLTVAGFITCNNNIITDIKLAASAAIGFPTRLTAIENALKGQNADISLITEIIAPLVADIRCKGKEGASDEYAANLAKTIILDVLNEAISEVK